MYSKYFVILLKKFIYKLLFNFLDICPVQKKLKLADPSLGRDEPWIERTLIGKCLESNTFSEFRFKFSDLYLFLVVK